MVKTQKTKRALLLSALALLLCVSMLVGSTYAWFTDSVTSAGNIIKSGTLDVTMEWADGTAAVPADDSADWIDASTGPIFNYDLWEPGYTEVRHVKIENEGSLALKYQLKIVANGTVSELADVIDVYYVDPAQQVAARGDLSAADKLGTLTEALAAVDTTASGELLAGEKTTVTIALKMQETAGNEYQNKSIGTDFSVQLLATQLTYEKDSFNDQYDKDATLNFAPVSTADELRAALANKEENIVLTKDIVIDGQYDVNYDVNIDGAGYTLTRNGITTFAAGSTVYTGTVFSVASGTTLTLEDITVDGGAVWAGAVNETLGRGTVNEGVVATGNLIATAGNANVVLNEGTVIQNNAGVNAISLATRGNGTLTVNGASILNNQSAAGAVWLGGAAIVNDGSVIKGNQGDIGGVFRSVDSQGRYNVSVTINGGTITNNFAKTGGVIWSGNNLTVKLNGGEIAYNRAESAGGVIWGGSADKYYFAGDFEMHDNTAGELGNAIRFNHYKYPMLEMTGGKVYNNTSAETPYAFYCINDTVSLLGGSITDDILYTGGVGLTMGAVELDGVIHYDLSTNHNTAYLAEEFNAFEFTVNETAANFAQFNFKPAAGYVYTAGDEAKLVCMNAGYETYWDDATGTFRLQAI